MLLDMDGVLTDFAGAACRLFDREPPGPDDRGKAVHEVIGCPSRVLWARIEEAGLRFWDQLEPTEWADDLVSLAREAGELFIATSPAMDPASGSAKLRWMQKRFGRRFREFAITPRKDLLAQPGRLLVDDTPKHVEGFIAAGGAAVLFPTWANGAREPGVDPLDAVRAALTAEGAA